MAVQGSNAVRLCYDKLTNSRCLYVCGRWGAGIEGGGGHAMGRGRQKAKQAKVARKLKYYSPETDYAALERELTSTTQTDLADRDEVHPAEDEDDWGSSSSPHH